MKRAIMLVAMLLAIQFFPVAGNAGTVLPLQLIVEIPSEVHLGISGDPSTSITVSWWTSSAQTSTSVHYGTSPGAMDAVTSGMKISTSTGIMHVVHLSGLVPGTLYHYTCGGSSGNSSTFNFTTAPSPRGEIPVHFAVTGGTRTNAGRLGITTSMILTKSNGTGRGIPDLLLHTGDIVEDGNDQQEFDEHSSLFEPVASLMPVAYVSGDSDTPLYSTHFTKPMDNHGWSYSFNWGPVHFTCINYLHENDTWVEDDLESASQDPSILWIVASFNPSPYVSFSTLPPSLPRDAYGAMFNRHGVDLVISGHNFGYQRNYPINRYNVPVNASSDPHYTNPGAPVYIVTAAGAMQSEYMTGNNLRDDYYIANSSTGTGKAFFPSNHFCDFTVTVNRSTGKTMMWMDVIGLNYMKPFTTENYTTSIIDQSSITKDIKERYFAAEQPRETMHPAASWTIAIVMAFLSTSAIVMVMQDKSRQARLRSPRSKQ